MIYKILGVSLFAVLVLVLAYGPSASLATLKRVSRDNWEIFSSCFFAMGGMSFALVGVAVSRVMPKWTVIPFILGFLCFCLLFIFSLAFLSLVPERWEKEAEESDNER
jgi:peptidoglycan/LPS O-acetylase OafA/YrhL